MDAGALGLRLHSTWRSNGPRSVDPGLDVVSSKDFDGPRRNVSELQAGSLALTSRWLASPLQRSRAPVPATLAHELPHIAPEPLPSRFQSRHPTDRGLCRRAGLQRASAPFAHRRGAAPGYRGCDRRSVDEAPHSVDEIFID